MKKLIPILILAAALLGLTYILKPQQSIAPTDGLRERPVPIVSESYVKYYGQDGKNAFEMLQAVTTVEFKQYDFGVFVESIGSTKPDDKHFWKLYLNGQEAQVGADALQTRDGDVIEWKMEEIK